MLTPTLAPTGTCKVGSNLHACTPPPHSLIRQQQQQQQHCHYRHIDKCVSVKSNHTLSSGDTHFSFLMLFITLWSVSAIAPPSPIPVHVLLSHSRLNKTILNYSKMQGTGFNGHCLSLELLHCPTTILYCSNKRPWVFGTQTPKCWWAVAWRRCLNGCTGMGACPGQCGISNWK